MRIDWLPTTSTSLATAADESPDAVGKDHTQTTCSEQHSKLQTQQPLLIPIVDDENFEINVKQALLKHVLKNEKLLVLHSNDYKGQDLKTLFNDITNKQMNIIVHDFAPNNLSKENLKQFLTSGITTLGIFQSKFVTGMECSNVVYFTSNSNYGESVRCNIARAVQSIIVIQKVENNFVKATHFKNMKIVKEFIMCHKKFKNGNRANKCIDCSIENICHSCSIYCHQQHETSFDKTIRDNNTYCSCINCSIKK